MVKQINISIEKLGHEECESCATFRLHDPTHTKEMLDNDCDNCKEWERQNIDRATKSREKYREDAEKTTQMK